MNSSDFEGEKFRKTIKYTLLVTYQHGLYCLILYGILFSRLSISFVDWFENVSLSMWNNKNVRMQMMDIQNVIIMISFLYKASTMIWLSNCVLTRFNTRVGFPSRPARRGLPRTCEVPSSTCWIRPLLMLVITTVCYVYACIGKQTWHFTPSRSPRWYECSFFFDFLLLKFIQ